MLMQILNRVSRNAWFLFLPNTLKCTSCACSGCGSRRHFSRNSSAYQRQETIMNVFDRHAKRLQRDRAASKPDVHVYDYIKDEIGYRVADRIFDVKRRFGIAVELGCGRGHVNQHINDDSIGLIYQCEMSPIMLEQSRVSETVPTVKVLVDEEFLPFKTNSIDLVYSSLSLHWVNDLPGTFRQIQTALKPDGVFIGAMFGGETLFELRSSLQLAETEQEGGFSPHVSPFTEVRDLGNLMNRAGFTMLTIDVDVLMINYPGMKELMKDLQGMAENNCAWNRKSHLHRNTINAASETYKRMYGNSDGSIPATFHVLYMIGWKPDPSQPKPAARGSGTVSMKDLYKIDKLKETKKDAESKTDNDK